MNMNMNPNANPRMNQGAIDPKQIYASAYAAGRADTREEAITMAERMASGPVRELNRRGRSRSMDRHRHDPRPPSGVRLYRPADGYTRPRVGMDRDGLERNMDRLRLSPGEREDREEGGYHPHHAAAGRGWLTARRSGRGTGRSARTGRRDEDRLRREEERILREEHSNPFMSRPGLVRMQGPAVLTGRANEFIAL
ncbi:hypothetical protein NEMBOFW57_000817 [Staphylotrichum longicolle]|uniref:Uncharacterized protein n=1 Tax=Staphylotrichum longicolle TaxID=669026 RepID=A0AAD4F4W1_9PEZI|nr:hypothetical protein NEMBOFW57_000817 [Staphylotrichum longicolle]